MSLSPHNLPVTDIFPARGWPGLELAEVWRNREVIFLLIIRDIKVRYKQSLVGIGWAVLQPLLTMVIFTVLFDRLVKMPTGGTPYPVFALVAIVPWAYFVHSLTMGTRCLVGNLPLVTKVYFPRLALPISAVLAGMVDFCIAFILLVMVLAFYGMSLSPTILFLPFFLVLAVLTVFACSLWLSALYVQYRDVINALPFLIQVMLFITPIAYSIELIPKEWQYLYALNPMVSVVNGFRWALLGDTYALGLPTLISCVVMLMMLIGGLYFFRYQEERFADVV